MRYQNLELRERLAAEYALGALHGAARARFERLMRADPALERLVVEWQEELVPLAEQTRAVEPPPRVLKSLVQRLAAPATQPEPWWRRLGAWRGLALANAALATVLAAVIALHALYAPPGEQGELQYVGVLTDPQTQPAVVILAYTHPWRLEVDAKALEADPDGTELRLWSIDQGQSAPRFLTHITPGTREIPLDKAGWEQLNTATRLLISRDPAASPTQRPVGEVLFTGNCISLKRWSGSSR